MIRMKNAMSARMAFLVICEPQVGLTTLTLTSSTFAPVALAKASLTAVWTAAG